MRSVWCLSSNSYLSVEQLCGPCFLFQVMLHLKIMQQLAIIISLCVSPYSSCCVLLIFINVARFGYTRKPMFLCLRCHWCNLTHCSVRSPQQEDLVGLGKLLLALSCNSVLAVQPDNFNTSISIVERHYSADLKAVIMK